MIYQVEPLMVMAEKCGIPYKQGLLDRIWKLLNKTTHMTLPAGVIATKRIGSSLRAMLKQISFLTH